MSQNMEKAKKKEKKEAKKIEEAKTKFNFSQF